MLNQDIQRKQSHREYSSKDILLAKNIQIVQTDISNSMPIKSCR